MSNLPAGVTHQMIDDAFGDAPMRRTVRVCAHCGEENAPGASERTWKYGTRTWRGYDGWEFTPDHRCAGCGDPVCASCATKEC